MHKDAVYDLPMYTEIPNPPNILLATFIGRSKDGLAFIRRLFDYSGFRVDNGGSRVDDGRFRVDDGWSRVDDGGFRVDVVFYPASLPSRSGGRRPRNRGRLDSGL